MDALGLRLAIRGRSERPRRSVSASDMDEAEDRDDMCIRPPSLGCGRVSTGEASVISVSDAIWLFATDTVEQRCVGEVQRGGCGWK